MDADLKGTEQNDTIFHAADEGSSSVERVEGSLSEPVFAGGSVEDGEPLVVHNLLDVLFPTKTPPPTPRNARVIRRFDLEAAQYDARPAPEQPVVVEQQEPSPTREETRALRNRSLRAAAGYF